MTGTTIKKAGSKEAFRAVHDLPLSFAWLKHSVISNCALEGKVFGIMRLIPVSGTHVHNFSDPAWSICRCTKQAVGAIVKGKRNEWRDSC